MKKALLALNLFAIIATLGLIQLSEGVYRSRVLLCIRDLNVGYLNEEKIEKELPDPKYGTTMQAYRFATSNVRPFGGGLTGYPAILFFGINSLILAISIYRERPKNRA